MVESHQAFFLPSTEVINRVTEYLNERMEESENPQSFWSKLQEGQLNGFEDLVPLSLYSRSRQEPHDVYSAER
jgi:hypothetical protein